MRNLWFVCLLIGTMAWAQAKLATPSAAPNHPAVADEQDDDTQKPPSATGVAADAAVLTVRGLCAQSTPTPGAERAKSACQTVVTRAQFESLVDALHAGKDAQTMRHLAQAYPQFLVMAREAEQRGLDKQSRFKQRMDFARLQILSQELMSEFQEEAAQVPESDIENYYQKNGSEFESVSVERIVIPNRAQVTPQSNQQAAEQGKAAEDVMTKEAERLRIRAGATWGSNCTMASCDVDAVAHSPASRLA